jgi:protein containing cytochrome c heme binding domain protein
MKKHFLTLASIALLTACGGNTNKNNNSTAENNSTQASTPEQTSAPATSEPDFPDWQNYKGVNPITITPPLADTPDAALAAKGEEIFNSYCTTCHRPKKRLTGPAMVGLLERRTPEWVMNMILVPDKMEKEDPIAKKMVEEYKTLMLNQRLTEQQAREVLEYLRTIK